MPIKPYIPSSPPLRPTHIGLPTRRISALIIEEDLSDVDSSESSWFLPANLYETVTISQKGPPPVSGSFIFPSVSVLEVPESFDQKSKATTAADASRRPSISLARLQTQGLENVDIKLPNYDYALSQGSMKGVSMSRRNSNSEVFFHSPLQKSKTYSEYSSSVTSSAHSPLSMGGSSAIGGNAGYESPVFYPDSDCDCDCACEDYFIEDEDEKMKDVDEEENALEESEISKSASSLPIEVPKGNSSTSSRRRRGCFVQEDLLKTRQNEEKEEEEESENSEDEMTDDYESTLEDWIRFAYSPSTSFETALISEVVHRRKSDERFSRLKNHAGYEKELENAQFSESHRRSQWMRDMVKWYPHECGGGHMLPCL